MKENKGITLVALIITIIVLLILATVSIKAVQGDGIIKHAKLARDKTEMEQIKEEIKLWELNNGVTENNGGTKQTLDDLLDKLDLTDEQKNQIKNDGTLTIGDYTEEVIEIGKYYRQLKVGQYVDYVPNGTTQTVISTSYSGSSTATVDIINRTTDLTWQIMSINSDDTISLLGIGNTDAIKLAGVRGYNNGVEILNEVCSTLYSNSTYEATARSINIEDIQNLSDYDYRSYTLNGIKYGDTASAPSPKYIPVRWYDSGVGSNDSVNGSDYYDGETLGTGYINVGGNVTQTYWTDINIIPGNMMGDAMEFFCNPHTFWIASRYEDITDSTNFDFGIRLKKDANVITGASMFKTDGTAGEEKSLQYLPVVTIPSDRIDPNAAINADKTGTKADAWIIK